jgi:ech hydrogenase subunit F
MGMMSESISNLFKKPATNMYPFTPYTPIKDTRGLFQMDHKTCIHCGLCAKACPCGIIKVDRAKKHYEILVSGCILCYRCADTCPKKCITFREKYNEPTDSRTVIVYETLPKGSKPPKGAEVVSKEDTDAGTEYVYKIKVPSPGKQMK